MNSKIAGCCSICDIEVFDVIRRDPETRAPRELGAPHDDACRTTFLLINGSQMSLTMCDDCMKTLTPKQYPILWRRVLLSWILESGKDHPFLKTQQDNGISAVMHTEKWSQLNG